ncbi:MAG: hypothetical protein Kow00105_00400 [Phycisphaeraceae bacterium]
MPTQPIESALEQDGPDVLIRVKVVPGASRDRITGMLGDRVKLTTSAPAEAGKANKALCKLLAKVLAVPPRDVIVEAGPTQPMKTLRVAGVSYQMVLKHLERVMRD